MKLLTPMLLIAIVVLSGCYHATVVTGLEPSNRTVERNFASSWVYGLVPPPTVEVMEECGAAGVARVETELSFVNQLVGFLTLGIYTPMSITAVCAEGEMTDAGAVEHALKVAAAETMETGERAVVELR